MKKLMISTALAAIVASSAVAQEAMFRAEADPMEIAASDFIGKRVYASEAAVNGDAFDGLQDGWEDIGEINDVILSRTGSVDAVLVDIGGFLGIGERQVAVDMTAIRFVSDSSTAEDEADYFLVMNADRASFEGAPEYHWGHAAMEQAETDVEAAAEDVEEAVDDAAAATETAIGTATDTESAERAPVIRDGYDTPAEEDLTTEMLTGAKAYDANDEWIGEVSQLIIDESGKITHAIIDVGGFLGIGEKPVELAMGDVDILRETEGDDVRVYVSMTKEELEALPAYEG